MALRCRACGPQPSTHRSGPTIEVPQTLKQHHSARTSLHRRGTRLGYATARQVMKPTLMSEAACHRLPDEARKPCYPKAAAPEGATRQNDEENGKLLHQREPSRPRRVATTNTRQVPTTGKPAAVASGTPTRSTLTIRRLRSPKGTSPTHDLPTGRQRPKTASPCVEQANQLGLEPVDPTLRRGPFRQVQPLLAEGRHQNKIGSDQ